MLDGKRIGLCGCHRGWRFLEFSNGNFSEIPAYTAEFIGSNPVLKNPLLDWYQYTERQAVSLRYLIDMSFAREQEPADARSRV